MSVINLLIESFDLDKSLSYIESEKVKQAVKEQYPDLYIFPPKIVKLVSGYDVYKLVLKEQISMAECIIQLDNNGNWVF